MVEILYLNYSDIETIKNLNLQCIQSSFNLLSVLVNLVIHELILTEFRGISNIN